MAHKNERWLDHIGLNLVRIVIGSYFMAISLRLISGVDPSALFAAYLPEHVAQLAGSTLLFAISVAFMSGLFLRTMSLTLAIFVLFSSFIQNYMSAENLTVSFFWRDLALVCAVMLSYCSLRRWEMRDAALLLRRHAHSMRSGKKIVRPRRVNVQRMATARRADAPKYECTMRPLIAPTEPIHQRDSRPGHPAGDPVGIADETGGGEERPEMQIRVLSRETRAAASPQNRIDEEIDNIFSNI